MEQVAKTPGTVSKFVSKHQKKIILVCVILALAAVAWYYQNDLKAYYYRTFKKGTESGDPDNEGKPATAGTVLKKGDSGTMVKNLQNLIIQAGGNLDQYGVDGAFGSETEKALETLTGAVEISVNGFMAFVESGGNNEILGTNFLENQSY